ncbi:MAG TPA: glucokinase [Chitinophagaceae bacterium]|nr:glucokinase [Chitinophagaceae bacterium]
MIPIIFSDRLQHATTHQTVLAADVGGTKVNLAVYTIDSTGKPVVVKSAQYHSASFTSFSAILHKFFAETGVEKPGSICAGVAGAIVNDAAELVNLPWGISKKEIVDASGVEKVALINDLEANAYGLALLSDDDIITLHKGEAIPGNAAIIAPGTGLGEAGLFWDGGFYRPFATEGGHCDFAPRTDLDAELHTYLKKIHGIVSWEHVVSGPGIHSVYTFLRDIKKMEEPAWLKEEMQAEDASAAISEGAIQGKCDICIETMNLFVGYLARICTILALKMKATGGIFLGGGIPPKIVKLLQQDIFTETFLTCDRQQSLMNIIPIQVVMNDKTALLGAAYYGMFSV